MTKLTRFVPPNPIADKVEVLPDSSAEELCAHASMAVDELKAPLIEHLEKEADRLRSMLAAATASPSDRGIQLEAMHRVVFELKGLAGTFDYPLVSMISEFILKMIGPGLVANESVLEVIGLQVDAINLIIRERLEGGGGKSGQALISSLQMAMAKVSDAATI